MKINLTKNAMINSIHTGKGILNITGTVFEKEDLFSSLNNHDNIKIKKNIKTLTGFFNLIYQTENKIIAAVDHIRSHPLFYAQKDNSFYLSDNAEWVREQIKDEEIDAIAKEEFQLTGYVTGRETLYPNVKQLQAGEMLIYENKELKINRYYTFSHHEPNNYDTQNLYIELDKIAKKSIQRLIKYADGKQIVIPLSGGFDSRLIATLLKEANYPKILTFTYGIKGNKEANYSKFVADKLGLKWHFVEYNESMWEDWAKSKENEDYQYFSSNLVSAPHLQDCIAVKLMKDKGLLEKNAVFVPGHSGDFVAGSHIPKEVFQKSDLDIQNINQYILKNHYCLAPFSEFKNHKKFWYGRIQKTNEIYDIKTPVEFADAYEKWDWQERQSKFICNSVRLYEFYGYDWWLPLWDRPFVSFFENLPLKLRNHLWYKEYIANIFESHTGVSNLKNSEEPPNLILKIKKILNKNKIIIKLGKILYKKIYIKDKFGWYAQFPKKERKKLIKKEYKYNGIVAYMFLKNIKK